MAGDDISEVPEHRRHPQIRSIDIAYVESGYGTKRDPVDDAEQPEVEPRGIHRLGVNGGLRIGAHRSGGVDDVH